MEPLPPFGDQGNRSNGINDGHVRRQVFMPDSSLPPRRQKANFVGELMKKK